MTAVIVDTGPLLAFFDRAERHHRWAAEQFRKADLPLLPCEPVLAEAMYLLARFPGANERLLPFVEAGILVIGLYIADNAAELRRLVSKCADTPMALAEACIVRMAEIHQKHAVMTLDSDFFVYRKNGREPLRLHHPTREDE